VIGSLVNQEQWVEQAICSSTDAEVFFPERGMSPRDAKRVCYGCPVRQECLQYALETNQMYGVWGGLTEHERRNLKSHTPRPPWECRNGHNTNVLGRDKNGRCCQCHRDRVNASHRKRRAGAA
jgi:hypothetical protein